MAISDIFYIVVPHADKHTRAALLEEDFIAEVGRYLRHQDPFSAAPLLEAHVEQIVREARDRLVLIVELDKGVFGFELRSLMEFFAAGHLTDTALNSRQRFQRFEAIAAGPHWRNTALFLAGRVGRRFPGEVPTFWKSARNWIDKSPPVPSPGPVARARSGHG